MAHPYHRAHSSASQIELEVEVLCTGHRLVRPKGELGTCGWSPRAWVATYVKRHETPLQAFLRGNPRWRDPLPARHPEAEDFQ